MIPYRHYRLLSFETQQLMIYHRMHICRRFYNCKGKSVFNQVRWKTRAQMSVSKSIKGRKVVFFKGTILHTFVFCNLLFFHAKIMRPICWCKWPKLHGLLSCLTKEEPRAIQDMSWFCFRCYFSDIDIFMLAIWIGLENILAFFHVNIEYCV